MNISFRFISILGLLLVCSSCSKDKDKEAILAVLDAQAVAWSEGDLEKYMRGYWVSDSLQFIGSKGLNHGWTKTYDGYKERYPDKTAMGKLTFSVLSLKELSKTNYYMIGRYHLQRAAGDVQGYFTLLWEKIGEEWLIVSDHTS